MSSLSHLTVTAQPWWLLLLIQLICLRIPLGLVCVLLVYIVAGEAAFIALVDTPLFEFCPDLDVKASHLLQAFVLLDADRHG